MRKQVWITLPPADVADCTDLARRRDKSGQNRTPGNNAPTDPKTSMAMNFLGAHTEYVAKCYLESDGAKLKWHDFTNNPHNRLPDLENEFVIIDVKGRSKSWHDMIVQKDDPPDWIYLLALCEGHPTYRIDGWCSGREAMQPQYWQEKVKNRKAYFVPQSAPILKCVSLLKSLAEGRGPISPLKRYLRDTPYNPTRLP